MSGNNLFMDIKRREDSVASEKYFLFPKQFHSYYVRAGSIARMPTLTTMLKKAPYSESEAQSARVCPRMLATFPKESTVPSPRPGGLYTRARTLKAPSTRASVLFNTTRPRSKNGCRATKFSTKLDIASQPVNDQAQYRSSMFSQAIYGALRGAVPQPQSKGSAEFQTLCLFPMDGFDTAEWCDSQFRTPMEFDAAN